MIYNISIGIPPPSSPRAPRPQHSTLQHSTLSAQLSMAQHGQPETALPSTHVQSPKYMYIHSEPQVGTCNWDAKNTYTNQDTALTHRSKTSRQKYHHETRIVQRCGTNIHNINSAIGNR